MPAVSASPRQASAWTPAARKALRRRRLPERFSPAGIPWAVFTDPEVAQAGLTEEQAATGVPGARVAYLPMRELDRAITAGRTEGFIKIITSPRWLRMVRRHRAIRDQPPRCGAGRRPAVRGEPGGPFVVSAS